MEAISIVLTSNDRYLLEFFNYKALDTEGNKVLRKDSKAAKKEKLSYVLMALHLCVNFYKNHAD